MKKIKLEYPDSSIHEITVLKLEYNRTFQKYKMDFFDEQSQKNDYAILENENESFLRNPLLENLPFVNWNQNLEEYNIDLIPNIVPCKKEVQRFLVFQVYKNSKNKHLYLEKNICEMFHIKGYKEENIDNKICYRITKYDIEHIERKTQYENPRLKAMYTDYTPINDTNNTFYYYKYNNSLYIDRTMYEKAKKLEIEIDGNPCIIDNKNTYSITESQLLKLSQKTNLEGIIKEIQKKEEAIKKPEDKIIIYKDINANKYYIPNNYNIITTDISKKIVNKDCWEINEEDVANYNAFIITVYCKEEESINFTVANLQNTLFIPQEIKNFFKLKEENRKRIKIDNIIYIMIEEEELEEIKKQAKQNNIIIKYNTKKIVPVKK